MRWWWILGCALLACRAQVAAPEDGGAADLAGAADAAGDGAAPADLSEADLSCPPGPEQCSNGCDDDGNGLADGDDPACATQFLATFMNGKPALGVDGYLYRIVVEGMPRLAVFDRNLFEPGAYFSTYRRDFDPAVFLVREGANGVLRKLTLAPSGMGSYSEVSLGFNARDVCIFGDELVVVERNLPSRLHRLDRNGQAGAGIVDLGMVLASGCASDGALLYVSVYEPGMPSQFRVFQSGWVETADSPRPLPAALSGAGFDRCLDLAWSPRGGLHGLFVDSLGKADPLLDAPQVHPFAFDGGVGPPIDAGSLHGLGEFRP
jgi:hypothetical protein